MNGSALVMFLIGAIGLWGGLAVCLTIASKKSKSNEQ